MQPPEANPSAETLGYPRTFREFADWFPDDAACRAYLERLRWPDGFRCPGCGARQEPEIDPVPIASVIGGRP